MLRTQPRIDCATCEAAAHSCEHGWRAYLVAAGLLVACPDCAERYGEDERPT